MNTHVKIESPTSYVSKVMIKIKVFKMKVKGHSQGKKCSYLRKVFFTRNTNMKYESPTSYSSKVKIKVNLFKIYVGQWLRSRLQGQQF